jgi:tripartite motif-containing protein 37
VFRLTNYTQLKNNQEIVYSPTLLAFGITWRLKVYPNGNGASEGQHISVFLEMVKGIQSTQTYEYKIEMINQIHP